MSGRAPRIVRAAECRRMRWKNGGGETTEIAVWPPEAGLDAFEWRVSMARVAADGPFSMFAGIDRTLAVLEGEGIRLAAGEAPEAVLRVGDAPLGFAADVPTAATLIGGPITDLNVMTRRGRWRHHVRRLDVSAAQALRGCADTTLLLVYAGAAGVAGTDRRLEARDALILHGPGDLTLVPEGLLRLFVVDLDRGEP